MNFRSLRDIAKPQIVALFDALKRSAGLSVGEIAEELGMSYMGVKAYCVDLKKRGYFDTWRRPKEVGRPEITYRLTHKAQLLFPQLSNELTMDVLESVRQIFGPNATEKVLFHYWNRKTETYAKKLKGKSVTERAVSLARLRDAEGHFSQCEYHPKLGFRIVEFHNPLRQLTEDYPSVVRLEEAMFAKLLQTQVIREVETVSGLARYTFRINTMAAQLPAVAEEPADLVLS